MENETIYTFSPELLTTIAQLLQLAILTGTDLYDHLQTLQMVSQDGKLHMSEAYAQKLLGEIARLDSQASVISSQQPNLGIEIIPG